MIHPDLVAAVILLLCFAYGMTRGLLSQAVSLGALIAACAGGWCALFLLRVLPPGSHFSSLPASTLLCVVAFSAAYAAARRAGMRLARDKALIFGKGTGDRILGGAFALAAAGTVMLIAVWTLDSLVRNRLRERPRAAALWEESHAVRWGLRARPAVLPLPLRRMNGFLTAVMEEESRAALREQPEYVRLTANPRYRAVKEGGVLREAVSAKDPLRPLKDRRMRALLCDEFFWRDMRAVRWEAALQKGAAPLSPAPESPAGTPPPPPPSAPPTVAPPREEAGTLLRLKNGAVMRGTIVRESPAGIMMDVRGEGGTVTMFFIRDEIERVEGAPAASAVPSPPGAP